MRARGRTPSIRSSLFRSFVLLILLSSLTVLVLTTCRARKAETRLSLDLIQKGSDRAKRELDRFIRPAREGVETGLLWGRAGMLRIDGVTRGDAGTVTDAQRANARRLNALLLPSVLQPAISSVQVANGRGDGFLLLQLPGGDLKNRVVSRAAWGTQTLWFDVARDGGVANPEWKEVDYEPRKRAWYEGLEGTPAGTIHWTAPYVFFTTQDLGITASGRWLDGELDCVIAYDVLLTALTEFTQSEAAQVSENSQTVILTEDRKILGLPRHPNYVDEARIRESFLKDVAELDTPEIHAAVEQAGDQKNVSAFEFEAPDGASWWAGLANYPLQASQTLRVGVVIPSDDLVGELSTLRLFLVVATAFALIAAMIYSFALARAYSRPLEALAVQSRRIRDLDFESPVRVDARLHELQELAEAQDQSLSALQSFSRYVPLDVVKDLVAAGEVARIGGETRHLTVLFTDIVGFTTLSESMAPQALADHMAEYFEAMIETLQTHGATVDKLVGDAIVAFWGAPKPMPDHARRAVEAVLACLATLTERNEAWRARGLPALPTRFGLATGPVVVGNIGAHSRLAYTVLGDTVNFASRLEGLNKVYGTFAIASAAVRDACGGRYVWRRVDRAVVVGKTDAAEIFELVGRAGAVPDHRVAAARAYEEAWDLYAAGAFAAATERLRRLEADDGLDPAGARLLGLCETYLQDPPGPGWDGVARMTKK